MINIVSCVAEVNIHDGQVDHLKAVMSAMIDDIQRNESGHSIMNGSLPMTANPIRSTNGTPTPRPIWFIWGFSARRTLSRFCHM
jgi:hypothetical protein